jgi:adenylosuccinate synthase
LDYLKENGFDINCINIGSKVTLVCPFHKKIDEFFENKSKTNLGTTKQGIGYAYADKMMRFALRM